MTRKKGSIISGSRTSRGGAKEEYMRVGESFGEACRYCGSTQIIVWPPSSEGNCGMCSDEISAWAARLDQLAQRSLEETRAALFAAEAQKRSAEPARRRAGGHTALVQLCRALAQSGMALAAAAGIRGLSKSGGRRVQPSALGGTISAYASPENASFQSRRAG